MKKIRISENELIDLIEKLVKENLGFGNGQNLGVMGGTPTSKYKDLLEKEDIEEDDITDNEEGVSEETLNLNVDDETQDGLNQEKYMESISESKLIKRLSRKLHEAEGRGKKRLTETTVGCAKTDKGCVRKGSYTDKNGKKYPWHILNNKKDGIWRGCSSRNNCEEQLAAIHA